MSDIGDSCDESSESQWNGDQVDCDDDDDDDDDDDYDTGAEEEGAEESGRLLLAVKVASLYCRQFLLQLEICSLECSVIIAAE
jgi:hypothetical protein